MTTRTDVESAAQYMRALLREWSSDGEIRAHMLAVFLAEYDRRGAEIASNTAPSTENRRVEPGDTLYGFCGGWFGDSYARKTVVAVGADWVMVREEDTAVPLCAAERAIDVAARLGEYLA